MKHPEIARQVAGGFRAEGWRIWRSSEGRWWAQRRADWNGHELYEHADADTAVRLAAKLRGVTL